MIWLIYRVKFLHLVSVLQLDLRHMNQLPTNNSIGIAMDLRFQININLTVSGLCCHSSHNYIQSKSIFLKTHGIIVTFAFLLKCFGCLFSNGIAITMSTRRWTPPPPSFSFSLKFWYMIQHFQFQINFPGISTSLQSGMWWRFQPSGMRNTTHVVR